MEIEELCGLEFHHKMQVEERIEELVLELQSLGRKAFPSNHGREFDSKGRFFKHCIACTVAKKVGAEETFQDLYNRAKMFE